MPTAKYERFCRSAWDNFDDDGSRPFRLQETFSVQINISARHGHLAPTTQEKISDKVEAVRKFYDRITSIQVTVDLEHRERPNVELRVSAEHHDDFVATETADNALAALDSVIDKIEQQLRKHKERLKDHKVPGHKHLPPPPDAE